MSETKPYIGGQAVLEGVMMRAPECMTVAVRRPDGTIVLKEELLSGGRKGVWKLPGFRGMAALVESMRLGYRALAFSAEHAFEERPEGESSWAMVLSTLIAITLFIVIPQGLASGAGWLFGVDLALDDWRFHFVTGVFKLLVITGYMVFVSRVPEMRRVFQYHGAEHKTIFTYEEGLPLTVENVRKQSTLHPRCGTTFLIMVVAVAVVLIVALAPLLAFKSGAVGWIQVLAVRLALLPVIAGVAFELQRFTARYCTTGPLRVLLWPGFLFQKITTREPDDAQIEIAIAAMRAAEWRGAKGDKEPVSDAPRFFEGFDGLIADLSLDTPSVQPAA
ncbi:MAG: DUF1385 domain-containing protein [Myxococcales bacterium]|nr:DUF1385 domain-containing protein [Myxococcales bacterium]